MHLGILITSYRKKGNSNLLGKLVLKEIQKDGSTGELIYLKDYKIQECEGCMECVFRGKLCKLDDDLYKLLDKIRNVDALVLIAPTYVLSIPGSLMLVIDRYLTIPAYLGYKMDKPAISIGVAALKDWHQFQLPLMNLLLLCMGFRIVDSFMAYGAGPGEVLLTDVVERLQKAIKLLKAPLKPLESQVSKHCPVDFCTLFERIDENTYRCPVCLTPCTPVKDGFYFKAEDLNKHRFTPDKVHEHFDNWILKTKDRLKEKLREIYKKKQELGLI